MRASSSIRASGLAGALWALVLSSAVVRGASAQAAAGPAPGGPCNLYFDNTATTRVTSVKLPGGKYNSFSGGGVIAHCTNQPGVRLKSDSAEYYDEQGLLYLIGHVHYTDPRANIDAHHMTYYTVTERLLADTNVVAVMPSGTTMHGSHADYLRQIPNVRPRAQLTAPGRPHFHLVQRDSATATPDTAGIDANTVFMDGDSLVYASHKVVIKRTDLIATGDSAFLNEGTGFARLMRTPGIHGTQAQHPFTLRGDVIDIYTVNHQLNRVVSILHADAVSKEMHLTSDTIDLRFTEKVLSRANAWGPSRAHATTPDRDILADSIDVIMPGQVIHQIRSVRKAYATADPDTTHFKSKERDWMKGDTIVAFFDTSRAPHASGTPGPAPPPGDSAGGAETATQLSLRGGGDGTPAPGAGRTAKPATDSQPEVRTLVADGDAHAFYQVAPRDKTMKIPAINYVRGRVVTIQFEHRQVQTVQVTDSANGVFLEPQADTVAKDSARRAHALLDTLPKPKKGKRGAKGAAAAKAHADSARTDSSAAPKTPPDSSAASKTPPDSGAARKTRPDSGAAPKTRPDSGAAPKTRPDSGAAPKTPTDSTSAPRRPSSDSTAPVAPARSVGESAPGTALGLKTWPDGVEGAVAVPLAMGPGISGAVDRARRARLGG